MATNLSADPTKSVEEKNDNPSEDLGIETPEVILNNDGGDVVAQEIAGNHDNASSEMNVEVGVGVRWESKNTHEETDPSGASEFSSTTEWEISASAVEKSHEVTVDRDALRAFQLITAVHDNDFFYEVWAAMKAMKPPWQHQGMKYITPNGTNTFETAKEMQRYLDLDPSLVSKAGRCHARKLRDDLLEAVFLKRLQEKQKKGNQKRTLLDSDAVNLDSNKKTKDQRVEETEHKSDSPTTINRENRTKENISVTAMERGAEIWLAKPKPIRKIKHSEVEEQKVADLVFPSPKESADSIQTTLSLKQKEKDCLEQIEKDFKDQFSTWIFLLGSHHSLLLYGFGSKHALLESFVLDELKFHGDVLVIQGYKFPTIHKIVELMKDLVSGNEFGGNALIRGAAMGEYLAQTRQRPLFLVIHNLDGLRSRATHDFLSSLVSNSASSSRRMVRLVASIDHVNTSALLWTVETTEKYSWIWKKTNTYRPYYKEVAASESNTGSSFSRHKLKQNAQKESLASIIQSGKGLRNVLRSLAPRHAEVLQALSILILEQSTVTSGSVSNTHVSYPALKRMCRDERWIKMTDAAFQLVFQELKDHGMLEYEINKEESTMMLSMPHPREVLQEVVDFQP
uniref:Origin recognition complex subunit 2 n=1 Tax=Attheya septentrionalis TaxID=420275 RepID=A0A7S2U9D3_9STRA|mmetsp:Transcript_13179/g.23902  ORF Transcript_13179/g.23902 Transcript_13179/m.23902 type:complete len:625 (+) Transcript_13179:65-1939(+)